MDHHGYLQGVGSEGLSVSRFTFISMQIMIPHIQKMKAKPGLEDKPALLFLDGHISHEEPTSAQALKDINCDIYELFPHSSLVTQPLDLTVFNTWRCNLRKVGVLIPFV